MIGCQDPAAWSGTILIIAFIIGVCYLAWVHAKYPRQEPTKSSENEEIEPENGSGE